MPDNNAGHKSKRTRGLDKNIRGLMKPVSPGGNARNRHLFNTPTGRVAEWLIAAVLKTVERKFRSFKSCLFRHHKSRLSSAVERLICNQNVKCSNHLGGSIFTIKNEIPKIHSSNRTTHNPVVCSDCNDHSAIYLRRY